MKSPTRIAEWPHSKPGINAVVVLIIMNCLILAVQLSSNVSIYERSWWPRAPQMPLQTCTNLSSSSTNPVDENLNMSSFDLSRGVVRSFHAHGVAARLIVEVGTYRSGPRMFSSVAMVSKRLNNLHNISYECEWESLGRKRVKVAALAIKPDWNMGRMYGTMVLVCNFPEDVGTNAEGGRLVLTAGYADNYRNPERFVALTEAQGDYNASTFSPPYPYDIAFCGSPLYGDISPQRIREWIAYHNFFFGNHTVFIFHDAGGIHEDVYRVLKPWIDLGRVRVQNLRKAEVYEGYYHHQFTMLNDCMIRSQTLANWTFFFDVDEFLYIPAGAQNLTNLLVESARNNVTQIHFENLKMSDGLCQKQDRRANLTSFAAEIARKWTFEKLVYSKCDYGYVNAVTRKYALQPRLAWATGVHYSEHLKQGKELDLDIDVLRSYHYHNTVSARREVCMEFPRGANGEPNKLKVKNCTIDLSLAEIAPAVKQYEIVTVGEQPFIL